MSERTPSNPNERAPLFTREVEIINKEIPHLLNDIKFEVDFDYGDNIVFITIYGINRTNQSEAVKLLPRISDFFNSYPGLENMHFNVIKDRSGYSYITMQQKEIKFDKIKN